MCVCVCVCVGFGVYKEKREHIHNHNGVWAALVNVTAYDYPGVSANWPKCHCNQCISVLKLMCYMYTNSGRQGSSLSFIMNCVFRPL